jgi:hypothetical protein
MPVRTKRVRRSRIGSGANAPVSLCPHASGLKNSSYPLSLIESAPITGIAIESLIGPLTQESDCVSRTYHDFRVSGYLRDKGRVQVVGAGQIYSTGGFNSTSLSSLYGLPLSAPMAIGYDPSQVFLNAYTRVSVRSHSGQSADDSVCSALVRLEHIIADRDQYELDERPPSQNTIEAVRKLLRSMAHVGYDTLPKTSISVYYGEISVTWKTDQNLVRITFRPDGSIELYRQADYRDSARGESIPVTVEDNERVAEYIRWLSEDTRVANSERSGLNR